MSRDEKGLRSYSRKHVGKMRSGGKEDLPLPQRLLDQLPLLVIELEDGLLQVSHTSVYQLGRFRRSPCQTT